jgi:hypothetical protein
MKLIKPDHARRIDIEGVPAPVRRPIDIDQAKTDFTNLRTLRIYRFDPGSVIDGHAEEDEVFIIVLAGSVKITISAGGEKCGPVVLSATDMSRNSPCAAYLPRHGEYRIVAETEADVAYARATPLDSRPPKIFEQCAQTESLGITVLLDEMTYAEKLRLRLVRIDAEQQGLVYGPISVAQEAIVHVRILTAKSNVTMAGTNSPETILESWDTVAATPAEHPALRLAAGSSVLALTVLADAAMRDK